MPLTVLSAVLAFVLYAFTAAPSLVALFDDSLEFQLVLPTFAIAHPTGYPLYTLLGGVWSRVLLPFGNWAWRVNLFSALAAAGAVGIVFALALRLLEDPHPSKPGNLSPAEANAQGLRTIVPGAGAAGAALVFGLGPVWWAQATLAEVYALHNLLLAALLLVTITAPQAGARYFDRRMALLCLLLGLGLAHHRSIVLALPGISIYLLWSVPGLWRPRRAWLLWGAALLLPLLLYLYLPLAAAAGAADLHGSYTNTWDGFWHHVLAQGYRGFFMPSSLSVERSPAQWLDLVLAQTGWGGALLAVLGCTGLAERRVRKEWVLVLLVLAANFVFALAYRVGDQEVFLLPVFMCLALLAGGGVAALLRGVLAVLPPLGRGRPLWEIAVAGVLLALLAWGPGRGPAINRSGDWQVHDYAVDMATVGYPAGSVVLGLEGEVTALKYMQAAEGLGTIALPLTADDPQRRAALLAEAVADGAPAYLTRELEGIAALYSFSGEGPLVRVWPRGGAQVEGPQHTLGLDMASGSLRLEGYDLQPLDWAGGPALRLNLYWRPTAPLAQTLKTSIRLLAVDGAPLAYGDGAPAVFDQFPLRQVAPTTAWLLGELVRDAYAFYVPPGSRPAILQVILYDAETLVEEGRWETSLSLP